MIASLFDWSHPTWIPLAILGLVVFTLILCIANESK